MLISCPNYDTVLGKHDGTLTWHSILDTRYSEQWRLRFPSNKNLIHTCHGPFLVWSFLSLRRVPMIQSGSGFISLWGLYWILKLTDMGNSDIQSTTKCLTILFYIWFPCPPHIYIDSDTPQQCQEFIRRYCENLSQWQKTVLVAPGFVPCFVSPYGLITKLITRKEVCKPVDMNTAWPLQCVRLSLGCFVSCLSGG